MLNASAPNALKRAEATLVLIGLSVCCGCRYGSPELQVAIANHALSPDRTRVAFAVHAAWIQQPRGLATFPDGGRPRVQAEAAAVYVCEIATLRTERLWRVERPGAIHSGFQPWLGAWTSEGVYVSLRGYAGDESDPKNAVRLNFLIDGSGGAREDVEEPPSGPATSEPLACAAEVIAAARRDPPTTVP